jgi:hypothetical protein
MRVGCGGVDKLERGSVERSTADLLNVVDGVGHGHICMLHSLDISINYPDYCTLLLS